MTTPLRVLSAEEYQSRLKVLMGPQKPYHAFYSSLIGGVVTDPALMTVPLDDHMVHRGHAVFDTATIAAGRLYRLDVHLDRFEASAAKARIPLPMSRAEMVSVIQQTCALSGLRDGSVRYWLSAGPGDFCISPAPDAKSCLYVLVFEGIPYDPEVATAGIHEATVPDIPPKPPLLATLKSTNYLLNALTAMAAGDRGGMYGIGLVDGWVTEACTSNVALVDQQGVLRTPAFHNILAGTTVRRAMQLAAKLDKGPLTVVQGPVHVDELYAAAEVLLLAGDWHVCPVVELDGRPIGDGRPGPVFKAIQSALEAEMAAGDTADFHTIPYPEA